MTDTYSPLNIDLQELTNLEGVLKILKNNIFTTLNVCLPAKVISYNSTDNTVDLQPSIQKIMQNNTTQDRAILSNVPVLALGGNGLTIRIPLKKGDTGIVIFCDRDITLFKEILDNSKPMSVQPQTLRKHDLADGIFIPSTFSKIAPANTDTNNITIQNSAGSSKITLKNDGIDIVGNLTVTGDLTATGDIVSQGKMEAGNGATGTFSDTGSGASGKTLTITKGIITQIA